ncbi:MAG: helix-turn-helix transcriptional regulator [Candidatus Magasanikbacteria bacterium]|nr:helix-turn-helix transcriptional regulator [Candidatus Magasanikbacteria bacterium]
MREIEKILRALANRRRLTILKYLKINKEASVGEIAEAIRLSFKATSRHLSILSGADLLEKDQRSLQMFYSIASNQKPFVRQIISTL